MVIFWNFVFIYMRVCHCVCHVCKSALWSQKRALELLKRKPQWLWATWHGAWEQLGSSARAASVLTTELPLESLHILKYKPHICIRLQIPQVRLTRLASCGAPLIAFVWIFPCLLIHMYLSCACCRWAHIITYIRANPVCLQGHLIKSSEAVLWVLFLSRL